MASCRFAKASTANKQLRVGTDYGDDHSVSSGRETSPVRHRALHPLQQGDRKLSAHGRCVSSMRTTASKRQSSLELAQAVSRLLDRIHLDEFDRPRAGEWFLLGEQQAQVAVGVGILRVDRGYCRGQRRRRTRTRHPPLPLSLRNRSKACCSSSGLPRRFTTP